MARKQPNKGKSPILSTVKTSFCFLLIVAAFVCSLPEAQRRDSVEAEKLSKLRELNQWQMANLDQKKRINALNSPDFVETYLLLEKGLKRKNAEVYLFQHKK